MDGISEGESLIRCSVHSDRGGAGGLNMRGINKQRSRGHGKENQNLRLFKEVGEH